MKKKIKFTDQTTRDACIARLRAVADGIEAGALGISHGDDTLALRPGSVFDIEVRADQHKEREQLSIQLSWQRVTLAIGKPPALRSDGARAPRGLADESEEAQVIGEDGAADEIPVSVEPPTLRRFGTDAAAEYQRLYAAARTRDAAGHPHLDERLLAESLAGAGVDPLIQQEIYNRALQANADDRDVLFKETTAALPKAG